MDFGGSIQVRVLWVFAFLGILFSGPVLLANPSDAVVAHGNVQFSGSGGNLIITQNSQRAVINWDTFSISTGELTRFIQPGMGAAVLNRVQGGEVSQIDGTLRANGNVFLINPNGILVGPGGVIDVGGFVGSTLDVSNEEFLAGGDLQFRGSSQASIVNLGNISAADGDVFLIAATVDNSGNIRASNGTVGLAAGNDVFLQESGDERVFVRGAEGATKPIGVENSGVVEANIAELKSFGGNIYGMAVQNEGRVAATGITESGGQIFLSSGGGTISSGGDLVAKRPTEQTGGQIRVDSGSGGRTEIAGTVDAAGQEGGSVVILGDEIEVFAGSLILADGSDSDGGEIMVIAEKDLAFFGSASAHGGDPGGDGGSVELSGRESILLGNLSASVDVSAPNGQSGSLLIGTNDFNIVAGSSPSMPSSNTLYAEELSSFLNTMGDLEVMTNPGSGGGTGNITVSEGASISWGSSSNLTFMAARDFSMQSDTGIDNTDNGSVTVNAGRSIQLLGGATGGGTGPIASARISLANGDVTFENYLAFDPETTDLDAIYAAGEADGIILEYGEILTVNGDIDIKGMSGLGDAVQIRGVFDFGTFSSLPSTISSSGTGNIMIEGTGGLAVPITTADGDGTGFTIEDSAVSTNSGRIEITGRGSFNDDGVNIVSFIGTSEISSTSGDIVIKGVGGERGTEPSVIAGFGINHDGFSTISTGAASTISLSGQGGEDSFFGILIEDPSTTPTGPLVSAGTVVLESKEGNIETNYIAADTLNVMANESEGTDVIVNNSTVGSLTGSASGNLFLETDGEISLGNISSGRFLTIDSGGDINVTGDLVANNAITLMGPAVDGTLYSFQDGSSATAPEVVITNGTYIPPGSASLPEPSAAPAFAAAFAIGEPLGRVEAHGDFDITNFIFNNIEEVEGVGSMSRLFTDAGGENFSIVQYNRASKSSPDFRTAALIDDLHFYDFESITGGASADTISVDLPEGQSFSGSLSGGDGDDKILIITDGAGILGTILGGDGFDTLSYEQYSGGNVVVDLGSGTATGIDIMGGFEGFIGSDQDDRLIGSSGADTFTVSGVDKGGLNQGTFQSFEQLSGGGGNDRFEFYNQATIGEISGGDGADVLFIDDSNLGGTNTYQISENQISRNPTYAFNGIEVVQLTLGPGDDTVVTGSRSFVQILDGGAGNDTLTLSGGQTLGNNPIILGGNPIVHSNFENPSGVDNQGPDSGNLLTQQVGNDQPNDFDPDENGDVTNNFNSADGPDESAGLFQSNLFVSQGAFSAAIVGQAVMLTLDGNDYAYDKPASLDGNFLNADYATILRLRGNLDFSAIVELAAAIGYGGPVIMIMEDGSYAIDLEGTPPAPVVGELLTNLDRSAAADLLAALEMTIAIPITSEDGVVSILEVPVQANPATLANLANQIDAASQAELAAALDGA